nr:unnamed protein product [Haemonchus contortus]
MKRTSPLKRWQALSLRQEVVVTRQVIKEKRSLLYSTLLKCHSKESACRRLLPEQTRRRIEGSYRENTRNIESSSPTEHRLTDEHTRCEREMVRVIVLGDTQLPPVKTMVQRA